MSEPKPFVNLPRGLAPLGYRDFALYWIGFATTATGRWIELTGLVWLVYELTDSPLLVGLLGAARALPSFPLSPIAGVVADRVNQRMMLFITQGLSLFASFALALLIVTGTVELWHIYVQVVIQAVIMNFDSAVRQALFPRLVPRDVLHRAVTLNVTAGRTSKFLGPAVGGLLIAGFGEASPFFVNAASFLGLMAAVYWMRAATPLRAAAASFGGELAEGLRYILSTPVLRGLLQLEIVFGIFEMNPAMITIIGRQILTAGPQALGFLLSAPALGSFFGIFWLLYAKRTRRQGRFGIICMIAYSCVLAFVAFSSSYLAYSGAGGHRLLEVILTVTRNTIMQLVAPPHMRGRVMANVGIVTRGINPLSETQSGFLAGWMGSTFAVLFAACAMGIAGGLTTVFNRDLWRFSFDDQSTPKSPS